MTTHGDTGAVSMKRKKHPGGTITRRLDIEMDNREADNKQKMRVLDLVRGTVLAGMYAAVDDALYGVEEALIAFPRPQWERVA